eukprot:566683-Pyramimonas_sp.AAC.1
MPAHGTRPLFRNPHTYIPGRPAISNEATASFPHTRSSLQVSDDLRQDVEHAEVVVRGKRGGDSGDGVGEPEGIEDVSVPPLGKLLPTGVGEDAVCHKTCNLLSPQLLQRFAALEKGASCLDEVVHDHN